MRDEYNDYDESMYEDEYDRQETDNKAVRGYRIVIIILAVILVALSLLYFNIHRQQQAEYVLLEQDREKIQGDLDSLIVSFDDLKIKNDSIAANLEEANQLMGTLRTVMQGYIRQIDSLNNLNKKLVKENISYKKEISTAQLRAEMAEERAEELNNKVRVGSVIRARNITMTALNAKSKEITRVKNAARLSVNFVLAGNELAEPGAKTVYVCITSPDGYVLSTPDAASFSFEGEPKIYSAQREVDYQNDDLPVKIFYNGSGFTAGTYRVELYTEGRLIGQADVAMR